MSSHSQNGFTLIEVLMALAIFSVAIMGLMHAATENIRATHAIEQKQIAGIIADNQLILALSTNTPIQKGRKNDIEKMAGRDWHWDITTQAAGEPNFFKLTITVSEGQSEQVLITRTAFASNTPQATP